MTNHHARLTVLTEEAKGGSAAAANRLAAILHKEVFRMIYCRVHSREDAEDLTQEVFIKMFKGIGKIKDTEKIRPWLFAIALNKVRDFKRWKSIETLFGRRHEDPDIFCGASSHPGEAMERKEIMRNLKRFMGNLPRGEGEVFMLRFVDKLRIAEISATLKKNESTVKTHLYRAIRKFRKDTSMREMMKGGEA